MWKEYGLDSLERLNILREGGDEGQRETQGGSNASSRSLLSASGTKVHGHVFK